ncbi:MAG: hypothetical protein HY353_05475 [Candidatus Omnitrophica bacterium]|nr:hypothetical protein [Candidatus Omnitrophota bacterium]
MGEGWKREPLPPEEQVLREQLEADTSFQILLPLQQTVEESLEAGDTAVLDVVAKNNAIREALFDAFATRKGSARAKISSYGIEGGRVTDYMIIEDGRVTVVYDASRDRPVSGGIHSYEIDRIEIGYRERNINGFMRFQRLDSATPERGKPLIIQYRLPTGVKRFF